MPIGLSGSRHRNRSTRIVSHKGAKLLRKTERKVTQENRARCGARRSRKLRSEFTTERQGHGEEYPKNLAAETQTRIADIGRRPAAAQKDRILPHRAQRSQSKGTAQRARAGIVLCG